MDDVKDKMKGLIKKVNNPFSSTNSSSGKFKGQGRVLGSSSPSSSSTGLPANPIRTHQPEPKPKTKPTTPSPSPPPPSSSSSCTTTPALNLNSDSDPQLQSSCNPEILRCVDVFVSGGASVDVISRLLKNIVKEPENPKFRKIRLSNSKIREAVVEVAGGVELLECVGFQLQEEGGEMWAVILDVPSDQQIGLIKEAVSLLEKPPLNFSIRRSPSAELEETSLGNAQVMPPSTPVDEPDRPQKIDRQVQVFFNAPESISAKIDVPESFYSLSATELKREADARKRQIAESQLLIPKSYKEKKAKEARKKYKTTVIRIQFPDEVVLQGVFLPWEPTTALYEFVSLSLKEPCLEFELWRPAVPRPRLIPRFPESTERTATLEEEELVPSALVKFKPIETDSMVFTGLSNELLQISESLK